MFPPGHVPLPPPLPSFSSGVCGGGSLQTSLAEPAGGVFSSALRMMAKLAGKGAQEAGGVHTGIWLAQGAPWRTSGMVL